MQRFILSTVMVLGLLVAIHTPGQAKAPNMPSAAETFAAVKTSSSQPTVAPTPSPSQGPSSPDPGSWDWLGAACRLGWPMKSPPLLDFLSLGAAVILTYLACHPIWSFWRRGWEVKKDDILSSLNRPSKKLYLTTFQKWMDVDVPAVPAGENPHLGLAAPQDVGSDCLVQPSGPDIRLGRKIYPVGKAAPAEEVFEGMYKFRYGRHRLIIPTVLLVLITAPQMFLLAQAALARLSVPENGGWKALAFSKSYVVDAASLPGAAAAAAAGAYIWVVLAFIKGASRANLPPGDVLSGALRMAAAVPIGYAFATLAKPALADFLAFAAGAFPLATVQLVLRRVATDTLKLNVGPTEDDGEVASLDGVDVPTADRLRDADVSTVAQLAYCDPVQVSMKTNIDFDAILDAQNQALAYLYFGPQLAALRPMGLRGAIECLNLKNTLAAAANPVGTAVSEAAARVLYPADPKGPDVLANALAEIAGDPYTLFLNAVWSDV